MRWLSLRFGAAVARLPRPLRLAVGRLWRLRLWRQLRLWWLWLRILPRRPRWWWNRMCYRHHWGPYCPKGGVHHWVYIGRNKNTGTPLWECARCGKIVRGRRPRGKHLQDRG